MWQESYEADLCGHVYCNNLGRALPGTPWQYCPVQLFYERFHRPMELIPFLAGYLRHPRMEHLVKMGFYAFGDRGWFTVTAIKIFWMKLKTEPIGF